jgi:hypothetical protein
MERCSATATLCAEGDNRGGGLSWVAPFARCSKAKRALLDLEGMVPGHITDPCFSRQGPHGRVYHGSERWRAGLGRLQALVRCHRWPNVLGG